MPSLDIVSEIDSAEILNNAFFVEPLTMTSSDQHCSAINLGPCIATVQLFIWCDTIGVLAVCGHANSQYIPIVNNLRPIMQI